MGIHWEKMEGTVYKNIVYCSKQRNITTNITDDDDYREQEIEDVFLEFKPYPFQEEILEIIKTKPDRRKIFWFWSEKGNNGKTVLCKHICLKNPNSIMVSGKGADIKYGIVSWKNDKKNKNKNLKIILFHFVRSQEDYISYSAIEECKDMFFFSGKYESNMIIGNIPHVIIFANFEPKKEQLSEDRWVIKNIDKDY